MENKSVLHTVVRVALPLLLICDPSYLPFATRHREELERRFVVRCATEMEGCYEAL